MKNTVIIIIILAAAIFMVSCEKVSDHNVSYFVTNSQTGFSAFYIDADGNMQSLALTTQSKNDKITVYSWLAKPGDIVYMSITDTVTNSFVQAKIFIDGKVYKEATRTDDNTMPLTVSGTVPY